MGRTFADADGVQTFAPFDGYDPNLVVDVPADYGAVTLTKGDHTLTWTVTGKNANATSWFAGVDYLVLELADAVADRRP